jgi:phage protein U
MEGIEMSDIFFPDALAALLPFNVVPEDVFMALGDYRFSMSTAAYDTFKRDTKWRWTSQERLNRAPAKQYVGPGEDVITLDGVIYPHYRGGLEQVDRIRDEADKGEPLLLVDGLGYVYDYWVITSLSETHTRIWQSGVPLRQQFSLTLEYYGEDYLGSDTGNEVAARGASNG